MNQTSFEPGPLAQVSCDISEDQWTLVLVRDLRHRPRRCGRR
jgi:hypothetical protein